MSLELTDRKLTKYFSFAFEGSSKTMNLHDIDPVCIHVTSQYFGGRFLCTSLQIYWAYFGQIPLSNIRIDVFFIGYMIDQI